ncbi:hypothetical protein [Vibrio nigripulchritudo]|nr:hypothetical protein [Vibrio nigripulchritudo]
MKNIFFGYLILLFFSGAFSPVLKAAQCVTLDCYLEEFENLTSDDQRFELTKHMILSSAKSSKKSNFDAALQKMDILAHSKNEKAVVFLYELYVNGDLVQRDYRMSIYYLELLPQLSKRPELLFDLGLLYRKVDPVVYSEKSKKLIETAYKLGSLRAKESKAKKLLLSESRNDVLRGGGMLKDLAEIGKVTSMHYYSLYLLREYLWSCNTEIRDEALRWHKNADSPEFKPILKQTRDSFIKEGDDYCSILKTE